MNVTLDSMPVQEQEQENVPPLPQQIKVDLSKTSLGELVHEESHHVSSPASPAPAVDQQNKKRMLPLEDDTISSTDKDSMERNAVVPTPSTSTSCTSSKRSKKSTQQSSKTLIQSSTTPQQILSSYVPIQTLPVGNNPFLNMVLELIQSVHESAAELNASVSSPCENIIGTCEDVLREIKSLGLDRDLAREQMRLASKKRLLNQCPCGTAAAMLPLGLSSTPLSSSSSVGILDTMTENETDRVFLKIEASLEKIRQISQVLERNVATKEREMIQQIQIPQEALYACGTTSGNYRRKAFSSFTPRQLEKLELWYELYPEPFSYELVTMRMILSLRPYSESKVEASFISEDRLRDWFIGRQEREIMDHVQRRLHERGRSADVQTAAQIEIQSTIQSRVMKLREMSENTGSIVRELEIQLAEGKMMIPSSTAATISIPNNEEETDEQRMATTTHPEANDDDVFLTHDVDSKPKEQPEKDSPTPLVEDERTPTNFVVKRARGIDLEIIQRQLHQALQKGGPMLLHRVQQIVNLLYAFDISADLVKKFQLQAEMQKILKVIGNKDEGLKASTKELLCVLKGSGKPRWTFLDQEEVSTKTAASSSSCPPITTVDTKKKKKKKNIKTVTEEEEETLEVSKALVNTAVQEGLNIAQEEVLHTLNDASQTRSLQDQEEKQTDQEQITRKQVDDGLVCHIQNANERVNEPQERNTLPDAVMLGNPERQEADTDSFHEEESRLKVTTSNDVPAGANDPQEQDTPQAAMDVEMTRG